MARKYAAISSRVFAAYPETFDTETTHTFENYRWAHAVLDSRAIWCVCSRGDGPPFVRFHPLTRLSAGGTASATWFRCWT